MNNRIVIKSVRIKNFRSIRNEFIEVKNMNIFVGLNDVGKSNVLKALNLFFNGQTDYGVDFDFKKDFSYFFPKSSHKTKEIVIELQFVIPDTYKEKGVFTWKKVWRTNGYTDESILNENKERPSDRSRVPGTLKRIRYRYVPAVKSKEYYKSLLSDLYFTVSAVLDSPLESSVKDFSDVIQKYTIQISDQVNERVGICSKLSIPENLSELFKTLVFQTGSSSDDGVVPLDMRGDGIQARHIPIILKYIADQDQKTRNQGSMKVATVWGFEEPENGVELLRAFEMANDFSDFSQEIQMFITSHSPAFYMKNEDESTQVIYVSQGEKAEGTKLKLEHNGLSVGQQMGLMPIVAPYIAEQEAVIKESQKYIEENIFLDIPTIMVEGKTDKQYLELAIKLFSSKLQNKIENNELRIFTKDGQGGCKKLQDWAFAWIYSGNTSQALILFDKDFEGRHARASLLDNPIYKQKRSSAAIQAKFLEPSPDIIKLMKRNIDPYYEIEHLLSVECWKELKIKNLTEMKADSELYTMCERHLKRDKNIDTILDEIIPEYDLLNTIVTLDPHKDKKERIYQHVDSCDEEKQREYLQGLLKNIELLEKTFT